MALVLCKQNIHILLEMFNGPWAVGMGIYLARLRLWGFAKAERECGDASAEVVCVATERSITCGDVGLGILQVFTYRKVPT